jgi:hypothetical protein
MIAGIYYLAVAFLNQPFSVQCRTFFFAQQVLDVELWNEAFSLVNRRKTFAEVFLRAV